MGARLRYSGILSRQEIPFVRGGSQCRNMDIRPYADGPEAILVQATDTQARTPHADA
jgi:hypothetical protein